MCALSAAHWRFFAVADDNQQVDVAPFIRLTPDVGAEQPDLLSLELGRKAACHFIEQVLA